MPVTRSLQPRIVRPVLVVLLFLIGFWLRARHLGDMGFHGDEDITALAVKGILDHGYPLFPTGMVYFRSLPFLYVLALPAQLFGLTEAVLRFPSVLFSLGIMALGALFARRLKGPDFAIAVLAVLALSPWEIIVARTARMYAAFSFVYVLTAYLFYLFYVENRRGWKILVPLTAAVTCTVHLLGFSTASFFLFPLLVSRFRRVSVLHLLGGFFFVGGFFLVWQKYAGSVAVPASMAGGEVAGGESGGALATIVGMVTKTLRLPAPTLWTSLWSDHRLLAIALTILVGAGVLYLARRIARRERALESGIALVALLAAYVHQFTIAVIFLFVALIATRRGLAALRERNVQLLALTLAVFAGLWFVYGVTLWTGNEALLQGKSTVLRQTIRELVDYPRLFLRPILNAMPVLALLGILGSLWVFHFGTRQEPHRHLLFPAWCFWAPLLLHGIAGEKFALRYNVHLDVFLVLLAMIGLWGLPDFFARLSPARSGWLRVPALAAAALLLAVDLNPAGVWRLSAADPMVASKAGSYWERYELFPYSDQAGIGRYVKERLQPEDIVVAMDWLEQYQYIGRTTYWIRTAGYEDQSYPDGDTLRDTYTGAIVVPDLAALHALLARHADRRVWILTCRNVIDSRETVTDDMLAFLDTLEAEVAFVGADGVSRVYRLDPGTVGTASPSATAGASD